MREAAGIALVASVLGLACSSPAGRVLSKIAGIERTGTVDRIEVRDGYLDIDLAEARLFVPDGPDCQATLQPRKGVRYLDRGRFGLIVTATGSCPVVGVGSLRWWRDRRPRVPLIRPHPRQRADFELLYRDRALAMLQGRFDLAALVGFTAGAGLIAVIPVKGACKLLAPEKGASAPAIRTAFLEFRQAGRTPYRLLTPDGACTVIGFIEPLGKH